MDHSLSDPMTHGKSRDPDMTHGKSRDPDMTHGKSRDPDMTHGNSRDPAICRVRPPNPSLVAPRLIPPALRGRRLALGWLGRGRGARATAAVPLIVEEEKTRAFLSRSPIDVLPLDDDLREYLELLGIKTIGRLQAISRPAFRRQFGSKALDIYDLALGHDRRRLRAWRPAVRIEASEPLEPPVDNTQALQFLAPALAPRASPPLPPQGPRTPPGPPPPPPPAPPA